MNTESSHATPKWYKKHRTILTGCFFLAILVAITIGSEVLQNRSNESSTQTLSTVDSAIASTTDKLAENSNSATQRINLCQAYLQKVRETADSSYYDKCDPLLTKALSIEPSNAEVLATQASVAYGRHNFTRGLELSQKALLINPNRPAYYGLVSDGQIELGQYSVAAASVQTMVNKQPNLNSFNRVAYIRELYGDITGAKSALNRAVSSGSSFSENIAYSQVELAKLTARSNLGEAKSIYSRALNTQKDYAPALEGLGRIAFAEGDYSKALSYFDQAYKELPIAQYATGLGATYSAQGNKTKASQQYYLATLAFDKSSSGGVDNDFEKAVFLTDQGKDLDTANKLAKKALEKRPNLFTYDALAWNFYKKGDFTQAQTNIQEALKFGLSQPIINYHAGMIAEKLGQNEQAKTYLQKAFSEDKYFLETHFSLKDKKFADEARKRINQ